MREIQSPTGLHYRIHESPEDLAVLTPRVAQESEIWIDTETADWNTKSPRLSLVQLRLGDGSIHVLDVLSPEMAAAYHTTFAPRVIAAPRITKWAHYARFERRILGADFVQGLHCTFELARRVPYHRLPLRSLRLAALVHHLCGTAVDKTLQRADWGQRPLSAEQLDYAAWDPEWCYRVHRRLDPLVRSWDPAADDPAAIQSRYVEILPAERDASRWRTAMWDAIKAFMVAGSHERFAAFLLQTRVVRKVPIRVLAAGVAEVDPMGVAEFAVPVPSALLAALRPGGEATVREAGRETISSRFRGPRAARALDGKPSYAVNPGDSEAVAAEYAAAWHDHRVLESERQELKERMRAWMDHARLKLWGEFEISDSAPRLSADVRAVAECLCDGEEPSTGLPARFLLTFSPQQVAALSEYVDGTALPILRWRPDRSVEPLEITQSREWHAEDESD
jgi:ribonuclease D